MSSNKLEKSSLIRKRWEFDKVYNHGRRLRGKGFTLICHPNGTESSRLGISIHKKIKGAVRRNRLKRIIRESFRLWPGRYPWGNDMVFTVRNDFNLDNPLQISQEIELLKGVLNETSYEKS